MSISEIMESYLGQTACLEELRASLEAELRTLLGASRIGVHSVSSRVKSPESLRRKLLRPDKTYTEIWDVTDLIGLRVITFFEDSIDEVASLIERNFDVDYRNSTNKLYQGDFDRFGYRSLHYVCSTSSPECELRFEIQIRTILQHAWAEIEHDLGYKAGDLAPLKFRRRFSRIASLLEIADQEFVSIRSELDTYVRSVADTAAQSGSTLALDLVSLSTLVENPSIRELDVAVAGHLGKDLGTEIFYPDYLIRLLQFAGLKDVLQPIQAIEKYQREVASLIAPYFRFLEKVWGFNPASMANVPKGYSLLILVHAIVLSSESLEINKIKRIADLYQAVDEPLENMTPMEIATLFMNVLRGSESVASSKP
jgi:ppGpp synthetase/RelA/SpoT-type nucleotidyltranferase